MGAFLAVRRDVLVGVVSVLLVAGCAGRDDRFVELGGSAPSPSGRWVAAVVEGPAQDGVRTWVPVVRAVDGREVFRTDTAYSERHGVGVTWLSTADELWILSSDVGTTSARPGPGGRWVASRYGPDDPGAVPDEIAALTE